MDAVRNETIEELGEKFEERMRALIPMGAIGEPDDIGHMVAYVASEKAGYMTGQVISIDGGLAV